MFQGSLVGQRYPALVLFLLIALLAPFSPALPSAITQQPTWRAQTSGVLAKLNAVFFIDQQRGWITGSNGMLLATEDAGAHWQPMPLPGRMNKEPLLDLWAFDENRLVLLGEYGLFNRRADLAWHERVFMLRSDDRGALWTESQLARPPLRPGQVITIKQSTKETIEIEEPKPPPDPVLLRLTFANDRVGWAIGELGTIQATKDGGATWKLQPAPVQKLLYDVMALDAKQAWIAGAGGLVLRTMDGGQTWREQLTNVTTSLRAIHFIDARRGWAVGSNGTIITTSNGGLRWQKQNAAVSHQLNDICFVNQREGWIAGERGLLLRTTDGGATWTEMALSTHANLQRLFFLSPDRGWVVGAGGAVLHYGLNETAAQPTLKP
jgi:photosystem II stability/assembly factor-like uncharacterized protein